MNTEARKISIIQQILSINNDALIEELEQQTNKIRQKYTSAKTFGERPPITALSEQESKLLLKINKGLPTDVQERYEELIQKNVQETLTEEEHEELLTLLPQVEAKTVERLKYLVELAQLWNMSVDEVMKKLEITAPLPIHV